MFESTPSSQNVEAHEAVSMCELVQDREGHFIGPALAAFWSKRREPLAARRSGFRCLAELLILLMLEFFTSGGPFPKCDCNCF